MRLIVLVIAFALCGCSDIGVKPVGSDASPDVDANTEALTIQTARTLAEEHFSKTKKYFGSVGAQQFKVGEIVSFQSLEFDEPKLSKHSSAISGTVSGRAVFQSEHADEPQPFTVYFIAGEEPKLEIHPQVVTEKDPISKFKDKRTKNAIRSHEIFVGMSDVALQASWGEPEKINTTQVGNHVHAQYVYGFGSYVYTLDHKVTSWQQTQHF